MFFQIPVSEAQRCLLKYFSYQCVSYPQEDQGVLSEHRHRCRPGQGRAATRVGPWQQKAACLRGAADLRHWWQKEM